MGDNMKVRIFAGYENENKREIILHQPVQDFVAKEEEKEYILDLSKSNLTDI